MSDLQAAAQQALEALEAAANFFANIDLHESFNPPTANFGSHVEELLIAAEPALRTALAEPVQSAASNIGCLGMPVNTPVTPPQHSAEPVAWRTFDGEGGYDYRSYEDNEDYIYQYIKRNGGKYASWVEPLYTDPPQRKPLSEDEVINIGKEARAVEGPHILPVTFARAIERAHGIGGK